MPSILVVEDEPAIAESIAYSLRRDGFSAVVASTLADAGSSPSWRGGEGFSAGVASTLADAGRGLPNADLVVLDLMLPDGSGFDLIGSTRRGGAATAVIVLSSRDGEADRVAALETGAD